VDDPYPTQRAAWDGIPFDGINPSVEQVSTFLSVNDEKDLKTQQQ
jgi:hypothetical protein